jgi:hypothetical protein
MRRDHRDALAVGIDFQHRDAAVSPELGRAFCAGGLDDEVAW